MESNTSNPLKRKRSLTGEVRSTEVDQASTSMESIKEMRIRIFPNDPILAINTSSTVGIGASALVSPTVTSNDAIEILKLCQTNETALLLQNLQKIRNSQKNDSSGEFNKFLLSNRAIDFLSRAILQYASERKILCLLTNITIKILEHGWDNDCACKDDKMTEGLLHALCVAMSRNQRYLSSVDTMSVAIITLHAGSQSISDEARISILSPLIDVLTRHIDNGPTMKIICRAIIASLLDRIPPREIGVQGIRDEFLLILKDTSSRHMIDFVCKMIRIIPNYYAERQVCASNANVETSSSGENYGGPISANSNISEFNFDLTVLSDKISEISDPASRILTTTLLFTMRDVLISEIQASTSRENNIDTSTNSICLSSSISINIDDEGSGRFSGEPIDRAFEYVISRLLQGTNNSDACSDNRGNMNNNGILLIDRCSPGTDTPSTGNTRTITSLLHVRSDEINRNRGGICRSSSNKYNAIKQNNAPVLQIKPEENTASDATNREHHPAVSNSVALTTFSQQYQSVEPVTSNESKVIEITQNQLFELTKHLIKEVSDLPHGNILCDELSRRAVLICLAMSPLKSLSLIHSMEIGPNFYSQDNLRLLKDALDLCLQFVSLFHEDSSSSAGRMKPIEFVRDCVNGGWISKVWGSNRDSLESTFTSLFSSLKIEDVGVKETYHIVQDVMNQFRRDMLELLLHGGAESISKLLRFPNHEILSGLRIDPTEQSLNVIEELRNMKNLRPTMFQIDASRKLRRLAHLNTIPSAPINSSNLNVDTCNILDLGDYGTCILGYLNQSRHNYRLTNHSSFQRSVLGTFSHQDAHGHRSENKAVSVQGFIVTSQKLDDEFQQRYSSLQALKPHRNVTTYHGWCDLHQPHATRIRAVVSDRGDRSLRTFILDDREEIDLDERLSILSQVLHGLQHSLRQGILHGDIRPENVLILNRRPVATAESSLMNDDKSTIFASVSGDSAVTAIITGFQLPLPKASFGGNIYSLKSSHYGPNASTYTAPEVMSHNQQLDSIRNNNNSNNHTNLDDLLAININQTGCRPNELSDVFAFGALAAFVLYRRHPTPIGSKNTTYNSVRNTDKQSVFPWSLVDPQDFQELNSSLVLTLSRCCSPNPLLRPRFHELISVFAVPFQDITHSWSPIGIMNYSDISQTQDIKELEDALTRSVQLVPGATEHLKSLVSKWRMSSTRSVSLPSLARAGACNALVKTLENIISTNNSEFHSFNLPNIDTSMSTTSNNHKSQSNSKPQCISIVYCILELIKLLANESNGIAFDIDPTITHKLVEILSQVMFMFKDSLEIVEIAASTLIAVQSPPNSAELSNNASTSIAESLRVQVVYRILMVIQESSQVQSTLMSLLAQTILTTLSKRRISFQIEACHLNNLTNLNDIVNATQDLQLLGWQNHIQLVEAACQCVRTVIMRGCSDPFLESFLFPMYLSLQPIIDIYNASPSVIQNILQVMCTICERPNVYTGASSTRYRELFPLEFLSSIMNALNVHLSNRWVVEAIVDFLSIASKHSEIRRQLHEFQCVKMLQEALQNPGLSQSLIYAINGLIETIER